MRRGLLLLTAACLTACSAASPAPDRAASRDRAAAAPDAAPSTAPRTDPSATASVAPPSPSPSPSPPPPRQLPRGGRSVFPQHLVVMAYGTAQTPVLGVLGEGTPEQAAARLTTTAAPFAAPAGRPVLPAFELITTIAQRSAGADGEFSGYVSDEDVQRYLTAARKAKMLLVLDFQPGRADVLEQVKRYERFLLEPEVGIALDPEWVLQPGQRPGRQIGAMSADTVNRVSSYLAGLTLRNRLPEKLLVVHQFQTRMLPDRQRIVDRPGLALVFHTDGFGPPTTKKDTYDTLAVRGGRWPGGLAHNGFKLFLDEDVPLLTPAQAMALVPRPELVSYQ